MFLHDFGNQCSLPKCEDVTRMVWRGYSNWKQLTKHLEEVTGKKITDNQISAYDTFIRW